MPRLSDTMEEGTIAQWLINEGDSVKRGDVIAEIETDKAVMDLEAYDSGTLEKIVADAGETVPIGELIAVIGDGSGTAAAGSGKASGGKAEGGAQSGKAADDADAADADSAADSDKARDAGSTGDASADTAEAPTSADTAAAGPLKASPVVRSLARTHGIDLSGIQGTGPGGRIIRVDVEKLISSGTGSKPSAAAPAAPVTVSTEDERIPLSNIRKVTAKRLSEAALVPAFQLTTVLDATELGALRKQINANADKSGVKISVTDLLIKAAAVTLRAHPEANAAFDGDAIIRRGHVNVGVAVALEDGLIVPVIKDADVKSLSQISTEVKALAKKARDGKLTPAEFSGGTFTISNLGMYGIDSFVAVLNPPEAAILAVGSTVDEPVVIDGEVQVRARSRLTLTVDHRVLDGAMGAAFLRDLTDLLTNPVQMLV